MVFLLIVIYVWSSLASDNVNFALQYSFIHTVKIMDFTSYRYLNMLAK